MFVSVNLQNLSKNILGFLNYFSFKVNLDTKKGTRQIVVYILHCFV